MYVPPDISRYSQKNVPFSQILAQNIYPVQVTDPNTIYRMNKEEFQFSYLGFNYEADIGIRIARTPLSPSDPATYAAISKFTEYNLRKFHSTTGVQGSNQLDRPPLTVPKELIASQSDGKTELLMFGAQINPLIGDTFKPVHLTPGCCATVLNIKRNRPSNDHSSNLSNRLFGRSRHLKNNLSMSDILKQPKNNVARNTSAFIERIVTCDNHSKKMNNANSLLIATHGRIINIIALDNNPKEIEVDLPCVKMTISNSVITCFKEFQYSLQNGDINVDILFGFTTGDLLWLNPLKMKYSRWNKNGKIKKSSVISIEWSKSGEHAIVGFADGDVLIFDRNFEDPDTEYKKRVTAKHNHIKVYKSLLTTKPIEANPTAHYKFSKKPITSIVCHPIYINILVIGSDDGFLRLFDLLTEKISDIIPSYYGGVLVAKFTDDGKYLLVGGEDDLVSIFEFQTSNIFSTSTEIGLVKLVTRLQGAKSWIKDITIDNSQDSPMNYTIGTASDDGYIRFYEFQPRSLRKVKKHHHHGSITHLSTPRMQMQKAFSAISIDGNDTKKRTLSNKLNNTNTSLASLNSGNNKVSLMEVINQGASSSSLQTSPTQFILGEGTRINSSLSLSLEKEKIKADLIFNNILFNSKKISAISILLCDSCTSNPCLHYSLGMESISNILPVCEKDVNLGRLSGLYKRKDCIWAFTAAGDLIRWKPCGS